MLEGKKKIALPDSCHPVANFMYDTTDEDCGEEIGQLADGKIDTRHLFPETQDGG